MLFSKTACQSAWPLRDFISRILLCMIVYIRKRSSVIRLGDFALTVEEEGIIVETVLQYADSGIPMTRRNVIEAIHCTGGTTPRRKKEENSFQRLQTGRKIQARF